MRMNSMLTRALVVITAMATTASAQHGSMHVNMNLPDSIAHIVIRASTQTASFAIVSRDGKAALLLMDTTIVAQMTDRGLADLKSPPEVDTISSAMSRMIAKMALGALQPLLDHGIAYHLRDLSSAQYADGRLQLRRANGDEVFKGVELGKSPFMESFSPGDAAAFAKRAITAKRKMFPAG